MYCKQNMIEGQYCKPKKEVIMNCFLKMNANILNDLNDNTLQPKKKKYFQKKGKTGTKQRHWNTA